MKTRLSKDSMGLRRSQSDLPKLAAPAQRALAGAGIHRLAQLSQVTEDEVKQLHGIGPNALKQLRSALKAKKLNFANSRVDSSAPRSSHK